MGGSHDYGSRCRTLRSKPRSSTSTGSLLPRIWKDTAIFIVEDDAQVRVHRREVRFRHGSDDLRAYKAMLPDVALNNLVVPARTASNSSDAYWMKRTAEQDLTHADMADARVMNEIIWYSVRGAGSPMPQIARLPAFDALRQGIAEQQEEQEETTRRTRTRLARR